MQYFHFTNTLSKSNGLVIFTTVPSSVHVTDAIMLCKPVGTSVLWLKYTVTFWLLPSMEDINAVLDVLVSRYHAVAVYEKMVLPYGAAPSFMVEADAGGNLSVKGTLASPG